jgi:hypothetical protein
MGPGTAEAAQQPSAELLNPWLTTIPPERVTETTAGQHSHRHMLAMNRPSATHVDLRRRLAPRDYCLNPSQYGRDPAAVFHEPAGGDAVSAAVARVQHQLLIAFHATRPAGDGSREALSLGVSTATWRRSVRGQRWMGETVMAAVLRRLLAAGWVTLSAADGVALPSRNAAAAHALTRRRACLPGRGKPPPAAS